jgi:hypothetical protein
MKWILRGCPVCGGDLHEDLHDDGWLECFMCARMFLADEVRAGRLGGGTGRDEVLRGIVKEMPYGRSLAEAPRRAA